MVAVGDRARCGSTSATRFSTTGRSAPLVARAAANTALLGIVSLVTATLVGLALGIFTGAAGPEAADAACAAPRWCASRCLRWSRRSCSSSSRREPAGCPPAAWCRRRQRSALVGLDGRRAVASAAARARALAADGRDLRAAAVADDGGSRASAVRAGRHRARRVRARALLRHAWPSSMRPICAVYGLAIGALLSGSFIVEFVTAWPGLGRLTFEALRARDVYLVAACAATGAAFLALGTMTGDLLLAAADPRVRQEPAG